MTIETQSYDPLRTLSITFDLPIRYRQISQWRNAFLALAQDEENPSSIPGKKEIPEAHLDHSTANYPLLHYRVQQGKANIFAINNSIEAIQDVLSSCNWQINWEGDLIPFEIHGMQMQEYNLRILEDPKMYKIFKWLAFNEQEYNEWKEKDGLIARIVFLEGILTGHINNFIRAVNWQLTEPLVVKIQNLFNSEDILFSDHPNVAFDLAYTTNILLPTKIAFGEKIDLGYGWQVPDHASTRTKQFDPE